MTTRRWTDTTPRASISDALDALVTEHGHELLACTEIEVHCLVVDTEPPAQAIYDVTGSLGGRWTVGLSFSARSSHEPVVQCKACCGAGYVLGIRNVFWLSESGAGGTHTETTEDPCPTCHGFGRIPVRVTCVFDVEADQVRTAERRRGDPDATTQRLLEEGRALRREVEERLRPLRQARRLVGWLTASAAPQAIARATEDAAAGECVSIAFPCPHLAHRDPRASHLGRCPDCGQVVGAGLFLPAGTACVRCGQPVEQGREEWAHPTCHACLPPPAPLPVRPLPEPVAGPSRPAGSALPDPPAATSPVAPAVAAPSGGGGPSIERGRR